jgi:single-strand DNA-binding protein
MDLNRVTILGRLTRDPELRTTTTGKAVASMGIATGRVWKNQAGEKQEKTEFHNCVLWGRLGEIAGQYLTKGRQVYVEGRLETRDWTGQDGVKRYRTEIIVENMIMLGGPRAPGSAPPGGAAPAASADPFMAAPAAGASSEPEIAVDEEIKVEDIPF